MAIRIIININYIGTMTPNHELRSVAVQCNLLAIPPLKKLGTISSEPDTESVPSDPDDDATDLDTSFHITQDDVSTE